ncbi:hypothetical protein BOX15_Mlig025347g1, partial [Macrostomum lignano]
AQSCRRCQRLRPQLPRRWHSVLIVQPLRRKLRGHRDSVPPERQLAEARALVNSIDGWSVSGCLSVNMKQRTQWVFTSGVYSQLASQVRRSEATAVFVNVAMLSGMQSYNLSAEWRRPVLDRYSVVLQAFNDRATSRESKLQIQLAEIPLRLARTAVVSPESVAAGRAASEATGRQRALDALEAEAERLRAALADIEARKTAKGEARRRQVPTVAVVGYTNAGKTSLVSLLARKSSLLPEDRLFATLHSSHHRCRLPCGLPCLLVDTIGFLSDLPTSLVAPFRCTLRDSLDADQLLHVVDCSDPDWPERCRTVSDTLDKLGLSEKLRNGMLTVYNKCDLLLDSTDSESPAPPEDSLLVSCETGLNLVELQRRLQSRLISGLGYQRVRLRCSPASRLYTWLEQQGVTVESAVPASQGGGDQLAMRLLMSPQQLAKFRARFRPAGQAEASESENSAT